MTTTELTTVYDNQVLFANRNKLPLFAYKTCPCCQVSLQYSTTKRFGSVREAELKASSMLFTGCYNCCATWCD